VCFFAILYNQQPRARTHACIQINRSCASLHMSVHLTLRRRIQVRRSGIHGRGVFAVQDLAEGERVIEYTGEIITWQEQPQHTFYFHLDDDHVIDGKVGGNSSRWINHSCAPNCHANEDKGRIFITTLRNIAAGEELNFDYALSIDLRYTARLKAQYACRCGSPQCRGTLLAPRQRKPKPVRGTLQA